MRSDARKRLEAQHQEHPDPAVRELLQKARAEAWDEGAAYASPHGGGYLRAIYMVNPYRSA